MENNNEIEFKNIVTLVQLSKPAFESLPLGLVLTFLPGILLKKSL